MPKLIPLTESGIAVEVNTTRAGQNTVQKTVCVKNLILSVVIGVRDPERNEKQRIVVNLEVSEWENVTIDKHHQNIVQRISDVSPA